MDLRNSTLCRATFRFPRTTGIRIWRRRLSHCGMPVPAVLPRRFVGLWDVLAVEQDELAVVQGVQAGQRVAVDDEDVGAVTVGELSGFTGEA